MKLNKSWPAFALVAFFAATSCAKEPFREEIGKVSTLIEPYLQAEDPETVGRADELTKILNDLYACYSAEGEGDLQSVRARIQEWRRKEDSNPAQGYVSSMKYFELAWRPDTMADFIQMETEDKELIGFITESALFIWNTSSSVADTFYCVMVWNELRNLEASAWPHEFAPTVEPLIYRLILELDFFEGAASEMEIEGILEYANAGSVEEFKMSYLAVAQKCADWIAFPREGKLPTATAILEATSNTLLQPVSEASIRIFREYPE